MAEHKHGEMDITTQEKTFEGFVKTVAWSAVIIIVFLVLLAMING
ncbi:aa3-type cytochrome c oxidase subunit IV [Psychromarinibacter sp. C21-152]|uniref:Aa3-type cytochrome c oxidase subunit IV n=1 Tax=Psychromarinibacter sediminicola TaxID=3033385 RepID=A0AAE3NRA7_9RHOB|nr:aa3-type cytochrome c oxidase subunit IV [Psychromarinibacter sediminicola]MDF0601039.1 aa3-type cytochrome c oxidase subunit IV [Psychromarinibacter sediminicola]